MGDGETRRGPVLAVPFLPVVRARWWSQRLFAATGERSASAPWRGMVDAVLLAGAYCWRDVLFLIQTHHVPGRRPKGRH